jgi:predicted ArsR family transcriptional regulator
VTTIADWVTTINVEMNLRNRPLATCTTGRAYEAQLAVVDDLSNNCVVKTATHRGVDLKTRDLVARTILESGPSTAVALAKRLKLTPAGIRRHLDSLISDGILEEREPHIRSARLRGRPSKVFVLSDRGRENFEHSYDDLAVAALRYLESQGGEHLINGFARYRAEEMQRKAETKLGESARTSFESRATSLSKFLSKEGYAASTHSHAAGIELCQHHCPIAHVAAVYPQLCEEETKALSAVLGTHVQRLATIAHGDGVCTTFIPTKLKKTANAKRKG